MSNLPPKKQLRAYFLVKVLNETQVEAAKVMGVTRQTVSRWIKNFYENKKDAKLPSKKQLRAYFLVEVMGEKQKEAARLMGRSRSAVSQLLDHFYKNKRPRPKGKTDHDMSLPENFEEYIRLKDIF